MQFAIFIKPVTTVWGGPAVSHESDGKTVSSISDEALYGSVCRVDREEGDWVHQYAAYGYPGWVKRDTLMYVSKEEARNYLQRPLRCVKGHFVDVLTLPSVHGEVVEYLPENALVELSGEAVDGWSPVRLADGRTGYIPASRLKAKRWDDCHLNTDTAVLDAMCASASKNSHTAVGGCDGFSLQTVLDNFFGGDENAFRSFLVEDALRWLGVQYRWGGRSSHGIDCSGLVSTVYSDAGVTIYRDASVVDGYPIKRLDLKYTDGKFDPSNLTEGDMRPGDAIYFPGHIAMYIGNGKYIHSTAHSGSDGVVINSLIPGEPDFRQDLLDCLYAVGGVR